MPPQTPRPYSSPDLHRVHEDRLTRLEGQVDDAARELAAQGERMQALHQTVERGFSQVMEAVKPVAFLVQDPERGMVVRVSKLEEVEKARADRRATIVKAVIGGVISLVLAAVGVMLGVSR